MFRPPIIAIIRELHYKESKGVPRQAEVAQGVPGRLRPRIFSTFDTTRVVGRQPNAPTAFTPGEIPGTHFQRLSRPQGTWFCRKKSRKKSQVTPPRIDTGTVRSALTTTLPQAQLDYKDISIVSSKLSVNGRHVDVSIIQQLVGINIIEIIEIKM